MVNTYDWQERKTLEMTQVLNGNDTTNGDISLISCLSCCNTNFPAISNCVNNSIATNEKEIFDF
jgi:hypothetical protein